MMTIRETTSGSRAASPWTETPTVPITGGCLWATRSRPRFAGWRPARRSEVNADGSYADEGGFSDGGIAWRGGYYAPWKIRVSDDDYVYVEDWYASGDIYRFDGAISSNSMLHVFAAPIDGSFGNWSGFCLVGQGANTVLWAGGLQLPARYPASLGIESSLYIWMARLTRQRNSGRDPRRLAGWTCIPLLSRWTRR